MLAKLKDMVRSRDGREWVISFTTPEDFRESFDDLYDKPLDITIKRRYKKRSLDANAFAWVLITKITDELQRKEPQNGWTMTEVYKDAVREIGGVCTPHCIPDADIDDFVEDWCSLGLGFQAKIFPSKVPGCTNVLLWKGSHMFNSLQMSVMISNLIQQAEGLGIHTITPEEEAKMIDKWDRKRKETRNEESHSENESPQVSDGHENDHPARRPQGVRDHASGGANLGAQEVGL